MESEREDDELIDFLLEHHPRFTEECREIRERMREGQFHRHEEVKKMFPSDSGEPC